MSVLTVEHLHYRVQRHFWTRPQTLLSDVSLAVEAGEIFGFVGPNGAGKTTTIKSILDLIRPHHGKIELFGRPHHDAAARRRIGFMPEQAYFPDHLTARELVLQHGVLGGLSYESSRARADTVLERVGLGRVADDRLRSYSKGMVQRAGLAQALVTDPDLVVLDEPMSGLDPLGRHDVREIMVELRRQGKTVFFSTHILPDVEMIADRVGIISGGTTRKLGRLADLIGDTILGVEIQCAAVERSRLGDAGARIRSFEHRGAEVLLTCDDLDGANRTIDDLRRLAIPVRSVQVIRRSLEDLFMAEAKGHRREESTP